MDANGMLKPPPPDGGKEKEEKEEAKNAVPWSKLLSYADALDWFLMFFGVIGAIGNGIALPLFSWQFGELVDALGTTTPDTSMRDELMPAVWWFFAIACGSWVCSYFEIGFWMITGERQANRIRRHYLRAVLRQEVGYFDGHVDSTGALLARTTQDVHLIQEAIGEKVGIYVHHMVTFFAGMTLAFIEGWKMTLVMFASVPLLGGAAYILTVVMTKITNDSTVAYTAAGGIVDQFLSSIRTVAAFGMEESGVERYSVALEKTQKDAAKQSLLAGAAMGITNGAMFLTYALALWYGSTLVLDGEYTGGKVMLVLFSVLIAGFEVGQAAPNLKAFSEGRVAGGNVFSVIERVPEIDSDSKTGEKPARVEGRIVLSDVDFTYPARPDVKVADKLNITVEPGQTVALVGESGSGKSTVVSLLQRFYDPQGGSITIDGADIKSLNLGWLRSQIGLVSQEPSLFSTTIRENIMYGRDGCTDEDVKEAAKVANAHEFIMKLPQKYDTQVGERGITLSGGQKQRVAIARAVLRDPKILLLDEATSALDTESEQVVQDALDKLMVGRSSIVIAHRLSTIRDADMICVIAKGQVVEEGKHDDLARRGGKYSALLQSQGSAGAERDDRYNEVRADAMEKRLAARRATDDGDDMGGDKEKEVAKDVNVPMGRLWAFQKSEGGHLVVGLIASIITGWTMPVFALALSEIIATFYEEDEGEFKDGIRLWCLAFVAVAVASFVFAILQQWAFGIMGSRLTSRVRIKAFAACMRQEIGYFDMPENSTGAVSARLETDAMHVRGAIGDKAGVIAQNLACAILGYVVAFASSWELTLVITTSLPFLVVAGALQAHFVVGFSADSKKMYAVASQMAADAVGNIRTVAAFGLQDRMIDLYHRAQSGPSKNEQKRGHVAGIAFGFSQWVMFAMYSLAFWYGGGWVDDGKGTFDDVLRVFFAILMTGFGVSQAAMTFPSVAKAQGAINSIFGVLDRKPEIDSASPDGSMPRDMTGRIEVRGVDFAYPSRPEVQVANKLNITVEPGQTVALVGESGSGKSTVVSLLQRFYDPQGGSITIDGADTKSLNLGWLRSQIGLVSQEPSLFSTTIRENIMHGREGATQAEVEEAAKVANAYEFIMKLPEKFETEVGERGIQLSGGQKQRVAIARAVLRNPKILLLDEATSALDTESEQVVQDALDKLMVGRSSIVIAHRLSTIRDADMIYVIAKGQVVEEGKYEELLNKEGGAFAAYAILQGAKRKGT